jgi:ABC-type phosphate transport system substrate-binding protein
MRPRAIGNVGGARPGRLLLLLSLACLWLAGAPARAQSGFTVVVNASNPATSMKAGQVSDIFLGKTERWEGGFRASPVDQPADSRARARFSTAVHNKDVNAIKKYWRKMVFSGLGKPPEELASDAAVLDFVAHNVGGIGYVSGSTPLVDRVKVLKVTELKK